jgi:hypothetical protein
MSARAALLTTLLLVVAAFAAPFLLLDPPRLARPARDEAASRAAFAVRDLVPPLQQWGTRSFTLPLLESAYAHVEYLTLRDDGRVAKQLYQERLGALLDRGLPVDLFLLAHTNEFVTWTSELAPERRALLRLVYDTGCFDFRQRESWLALGARAFVGHVGESASTLFYVPFLRGWVRDASLGTLVDETNRRAALLIQRWALLHGVEAAPILEATRAELAGDASLRVGEVRR